MKEALSIFEDAEKRKPFLSLEESDNNIPIKTHSKQRNLSQKNTADIVYETFQPFQV